jgi:hypothetical protein
VVLADATTVLMPDTPKNQAVFPQQSHQKPGLGFPIVRLLALISLATGVIIDYRHGPYQGKVTGETSLFSQLLNSLLTGDLLLADQIRFKFLAIDSQFWKVGQCQKGFLNAINKPVSVVWTVLCNKPPDFFKVVFGSWPLI